jgi:hypothetical protein
MSAAGGLGGGGGMSGTGGTGCENVDFTTDRKNCGSCGHECDPDADCLAGYCASSPCDGVCATFKSVTLKPSTDYREDNIGTGEVCTEIFGYAPASKKPSLVCWNFNMPRTLAVNGTNIQCNGTGHQFNVPLRMGGLCVRVTAGQQDVAGFQLPN